MSTSEHSARASYSPAEFAAATSLGLSTVRRYIATGAIAAVRAGRRQLIPASEFERFSLLAPPARREHLEQFRQRLEFVQRAIADVRTRATPESVDDPRDVALIDALDRELDQLKAAVERFERFVFPQGVA